MLKTKDTLNYFTVCDYKDLDSTVKSARNFIETPKIYISGQITGLDINEARAKFRAVDKALLMQGFAPINPFDLFTPEEEATFTWEQFMARDLIYLLECKSIFMMLYFTKSKGARLELATAVEKKFTVIHE